MFETINCYNKLDQVTIIKIETTDINIRENAKKKSVDIALPQHSICLVDQKSQLQQDHKGPLHFL
jgi:hypothetical protein